MGEHSNARSLADALAGCEDSQRVNQTETSKREAEEPVCAIDPNAEVKRHAPNAVVNPSITTPSSSSTPVAATPVAPTLVTSTPIPPTMVVLSQPGAGEQSHVEHEQQVLPLPQQPKPSVDPTALMEMLASQQAMMQQQMLQHQQQFQVFSQLLTNANSRASSDAESSAALPGRLRRRCGHRQA